MTHPSIGLVAALLLVGTSGGPPKPAAAPDAPREYTGKVVPLTAPNGKPTGRGLVLAADDGIRYPLIEDSASKMLFLDSRLRNRPVLLTALRVAGTKKLQVVRVETIKDGQVCDVDYWCETCQISHSYPGHCVCCGELTQLRERPAR